LFYKLVAKDHVRAYFCKVVTSATLYFEMRFLPTQIKESKDV
jgi:hypothetical protein